MRPRRWFKLRHAKTPEVFEMDKEVRGATVDERSVLRLVGAHYRKILRETDLLLRFCQIHGFSLEEAIRFILVRLSETSRIVGGGEGNVEEVV
jgi:hypothetical protein